MTAWLALLCRILRLKSPWEKQAAKFDSASSDVPTFVSLRLRQAEREKRPNEIKRFNEQKHYQSLCRAVQLAPSGFEDRELQHSATLSRNAGLKSSAHSPFG